jgi:hypothetical protein
MKDWNKTPDKVKEPYSYQRWKEMDLIKATPLERIIMTELSATFGTSDWLFGKKEPTWDKKDMREFVRDLVKKIEEEIIPNHHKTD